MTLVLLKKDQRKQAQKSEFQPLHKAIPMSIPDQHGLNSRPQYQ